MRVVAVAATGNRGIADVGWRMVFGLVRFALFACGTDLSVATMYFWPASDANKKRCTNSGYVE